MRNAFTRTVGAALLCTTLAVGGSVLAATPALAATSVSLLNAADDTYAAQPGQSVYNGAQFGFDTPISAASYTVTSSGNGVVDEDAIVGMPVTWNGNVGTATGATVSYTLTKLSANTVQYDVVFTVPLVSAFFYNMRQVNSAPDAQVTNTWDMLSVTPASTGIPEDVTGEPVFTRTTTWTTPVVDTPVIAPAVAGIVLLGAAGAGGGIALTRRAWRSAKG